MHFGQTLLHTAKELQITKKNVSSSNNEFITGTKLTRNPEEAVQL